MNNLSPQATIPGHLLELTNDVIWTATLDGQRLLYANPALERVYGRPVADFYDNMGMWLEMVHPDDRAIAGQSGQELLAHGHSEATYRIVRPDGNTRWLLDRKHVIYDDAGQPQYLGGIAADITNHKQLENELRISLEKYRVLFETLPLGITIADAAGQIIESNPAAERILGLPTSEQQQRDIDSPVWQIIRPDGTPLPAEEYASTRALREQRLVKNVEMGVVKGTGQISWTSVTAAPLPVNGYGVAIAYVDITERQQIEEALRQSERKFRSIIEQSSNGIVLVDEIGQVIEWNPAAERIVGLKRTEVLGQRMWDILSRILLADQTTPEMNERRKSLWATYLQTGQHSSINQVTEIEIQRPDGVRRTLQISRFAVKSEQGFLMGNILQDITERKQAEEEKERLITELQSALAQVKQLSGLLPICANCKKIRDDTGYWQQIEVYVRDHSEADFSHGICPDCMEKLYPRAQYPFLYKDNG